MNLNVNDWKEFKTSKLFYDMQNGKANQQMLENGNECFYVGAKKDDNGVMLHCVKLYGCRFYRNHRYCCRI